MDLKHEQILVTRLRRWHDRLEGMLLGPTAPLEAEFTPGPPLEDARFAIPGPDAPWRPIREGETWGQAWDTGWFRLRGAVPSDWNGRTVVAHVDLGSEGLIVHAGGSSLGSPDVGADRSLGGSRAVHAEGPLLQGITTGSIWEPSFKRDLVILFDPARGGEDVELLVEATAASLFGIFTEPDPPADSPARHGHYEGIVRHLSLAAFDSDLWGLRLDLRVLLGLVRRLPDKSGRRARLIHAANTAADRFAGDHARTTECRALLARELFRPAEASALRALAVGHAHIDTAWLWPIEEGVRKCARTFATQVRLLERYSDYVFGASQAQHYAFMKERHPALYEEIRGLVAAGRWEVQGGMWVEADCNLIDGESMVRQILHGKTFFREEFGVEVDNLWLPDVFGYSAALPQILRRSGIDSFLTQKLSWNQWNDFPHTTFVWRGIDGSEVLAHFPPENTYNSPLDPEALIPGAENFRERGYLDEFLTLFGVGDGGGGPKEDHLECGRRMADLEGSPRVVFGRAADFFARLRERKAELPVWSGELYLELHRGTLTSQAAVKRGNRRLEQDLRVAELLWSMRPLDEYPAAELDALWKTLLLHQFHDILPGSSIHRTYERTRRDHAEALERCRLLMVEAVGATGLAVDRGVSDRGGSDPHASDRLASDLRAIDPHDSEDADPFILFHPHDAPFRGAVELVSAGEAVTLNDATTALCDAAGEPVPAQWEEDRLVVEASIQPFGFSRLCRRTAEAGGGHRPVRCGWRLADPGADPLVLENASIRYVFSPHGRLVQALDLETDREILVPGEEGNRLILFEDRPNDWDAWDVDVFYTGARFEEATGRAVHVLERAEGEAATPVRQGLRFHLTVGGSQIHQTVFLGACGKRLDFVTRIEWRERHRMLRAEFPVNVRADQATFEIQYGHLRRPTHENTSWDRARFEVPAQRWIDLSADDRGVALLNDGKYGHRVHESTLSLNLLRSPVYPDPDCDRESHEFTYALLPHRGSFAESDVQSEAAVLNRPPVVFAGGAAGDGREDPEFPIRVEGDGIRLAVLKRAERDACRILRVVETLGRTSRGRITVRPATGALFETDLIEVESGPAHSCDRPLELTLGPFEIRTYKWKGWR